MIKIRSEIDKMPALELVLKNVWKNDGTTLPLDTQKQWFCVGGVAFFKVSSVFKKLEKLLQKLSQNVLKIHYKVVRRVPPNAV